MVATTMCAANETVAVVLDPSITLNTYTQDKSNGTWTTSGQYGTIHGISACLNSNHGQGEGGTVYHLQDTDNDGKTKFVTGTERYGRYCWCKAIHPVSSLWTFYYPIDSVSKCNNDCAFVCGSGTQTVRVRRDGMFGSIKN